MGLCDFVEPIKLTQQELYQFYCDPFTKYEDETFDDWNLVEAFNQW
jgi:hypothetical protein